MLASTQVALDQLSVNRILDGYNVVVEVFDVYCIEDYGIRTSVEIMDQRVFDTFHTMIPLLLGPPCTDFYRVGTFIKFYHYNQLFIYTQEPIMHEDRQWFSNSFMLESDQLTFYEGIPLFIKSMGWNKVFLLGEAIEYQEPVS